MTPAAILTRVLLVAALVGGVYAAWRHYEGLVAENASLTSSLATATHAAREQAAENARLLADQARTGAILAKRTKTANLAQQEADRYAKLLNDALRDPVARQWLDAPVPRAVWCGLRERPADIDCDQNGKGAPAGVAPGADAKPKTVDVDRLRLAYVLATPGGGAGELQRRQGGGAGVGG